MTRLVQAGGLAGLLARLVRIGTSIGCYGVLLRGLSPLVSDPGPRRWSHPARLRGRPAGSSRGGASLVPEALAIARGYRCGGADAAACGLGLTLDLRRAGRRNPSTAFTGIHHQVTARLVARVGGP
ncbi:MAG: hypothetical protein M3308_03320 [Actinomycetota bacterium]|nr:hypothetical protein [Actinomycetota bacterium]